MSSKNHTKNELARISAKIQELKKKYPVSPELYISHEKDSHRMHDENALQEIRMPINSHIESNLQQTQKILRPKSTSYNVKSVSSNQFSHQSLHNEAEIESPFNFEQNISTNKSINEEKLQSSHHQSLSSQSESFEINFMKQKPYKEYKEELKHLKKEILSGLDITNFPIKRQSEIKNLVIDLNSTFKIQPLEIETENDSNECQNNLNKENRNHHQLSQENDKMSEIEEYKNRMIQNRNHKEKTSNIKVEFTETKEYIEMKQSMAKLTEELEIQRKEFEERLSKLEFHSHNLHGENEQLKEGLKNLEEKLLESLVKSEQESAITKFSEYDLKVVEIQNQSINKLSKDIYKEIESIYNELNCIKETQFTSTKSNDSCFEKKQMEEVVMELFEHNMTKIDEINEKRIKESEGRFFRDLFDIKNEIQLLSEKLKKEDYLEKTIKQLIPVTKNKHKEDEMNEIVDKVKAELSKDSLFLSSLQTNLEILSDKKLPDFNKISGKVQEISEKVENLTLFTQQTITESLKKFQGELTTFVLNELGFFSTSFKEFETKMTSYGILIENLEETMKELPIQVQSEIDEKNKQKELIPKEEASVKTAENCESRSLASIENNEVEVHKSEYAKSELEQSKISSQITLPCCLIEETKKQEDEFFITKLGESKLTEIKNCQKMFLLEDLVKNSLVFSALNN